MDEYFSHASLLLKVGGMWLPHERMSRITRNLLIAYNFSCILLCEFFYTPSEYYILKDFHDDLYKIIDSLSLTLTHTLGMAKLAVWYLKRKEIKYVIDMITSDEFMYEDCGDFQPRKIFQEQKAKREFVNIVFIVFGVAVTLLKQIAAALKLHSASDEHFRTVTCANILPWNTWIPFSYDTKGACGWAMVFQAYPLAIFACQIIGQDAVFVSLLYGIRTQLLILSGALLTVRQRCLQKLNLSDQLEMLHDADNPQLEKLMYEEIKKCTRHMQKIISVCETAESTYTFLAMGQGLIALFVLVTCLFLVNTTPVTSAAFAPAVEYLAAIIFELMLYCWCGNEIILITGSIPQTIYFSDWISASQRYKKVLLINMVRMQVPFRLTIGKFSPLSLSTFAATVRGSYSYFAVLNKMNTR